MARSFIQPLGEIVTFVRHRAIPPLARRGAVALGTGAIALSLVGFAAPSTAASAPALSPAATATLAPIAADDFGRTTAEGWGTAPTGGAWSVRGGAASDYTVAGGTASMTTRKAGWYLNTGLSE